MRTFLAQISDEDFENADAETQADILRSETVRCKDCKNWYEREHGTGSCHRSENGYNWFGVDATDYYSFGERKENIDGDN